jgi:hypothetical protein
VTRWASRIADTIDAPSTERSRLRAQLEGFMAGAVQGVGNLMTPGDVALLATGPLGRTVRSAKPILQTINRVADAAMTLRGAERTMDAGSFADAAAGVAQSAAGGAGLYLGSRAAPVPVDARPVRAALPPGPRFVAAPGGRVAAVGTDIPMTAVPDGSYVRSVPGEYARREVRGALPPGPRFVADAAGTVAPVEQADELLRVLAEVQAPRGPDPSSVQAVRPAVLVREVDPTLSARAAVSVRQYAGDPQTVDAPFLDAEARQLLERAGADLEVFTP